MKTPNLGLEPILFYRKGDNEMRKFWDLVKESVIVQGIITLGLVGTTCYLWVTGQPVPDDLWTALSIVLGFFFGSKFQQKLGG